MNKPIFRSMVLLLILVLVITVGACAQAPQQIPQVPEEEVHEIRVASLMPVGHFLTDTMDLFCQRAEEMSDGRLQFIHYPSGQLMTDMEIPENIRLGTIDMACCYIYAWVELVPSMVLFYGPAAPENLEHYERYNKQYCIPVFNDLLQTKGNAQLIGNFLCTMDSGYIASTPLREPSDFQGLKIRSPSPVLDPEIEAMGGVPVLMSMADLYLGLSQGTIDGLYTFISGMAEWHLDEVAKYVIVIYPTPGDYYLVSNLDFWNELPPDLQQIMTDAAQEAHEYSVTACLESEEEARQYLEAHGVEVYYPTGEAQEEFLSIIKKARYDWAVWAFGQEEVDEVIGFVEATKEG